MSAMNGTDAGPGSNRAGDEAQLDLNDLFSLRKPQNAKAGFASGAKSVLKGVTAGVVGLIAAPVLGAQQEGLKGFAKGAAAGVVGAVVFPVTGVAVGATQVVRGIANQPEAVRASQSGKVWDKERREWIDKPSQALVLDDESNEQVRRAWQTSHATSLEGGEKTEKDYYGLLGVPKDATPDQIKKAYYMLARKYHPDKNPDDPEAKVRFQALGEAYQVLGNAELRKRYDEYGSQAVDSSSFMDSGEFFTMLFGSDRFEHLIGELMITMAARSGDKLSMDRMRRLQEAREERLAVNLRAILMRWVAGDEEGFTEAMTAEASEMVEASFGPTILQAVGRVYTLQADIALGNFFEGGLASLRQKGQAMRSQLNAAQQAFKAYQLHQQMEDLQRQYDAKRQQQQAAGVAEGSTSAAAAGTGEGSSGAAADGTGPMPPAAAGAAGASDSGPVPMEEDEQQQFAGMSGEDAAENMAHLQAMAMLEEKALPLMLEAMWAANVVDIQNTLKHVCKQVLQDETVDKAERKARAAGLRELGRIFMLIKPKDKPVEADKASDAKARIEEVYRKMQEKRDAADEAEYGASGLVPDGKDA